MATNPNISIGFSSNTFAQEVNKMSTSLKQVKKDFELSNLAIEATGDKMALAENKLKGFAAQAKILNSATLSMKNGLNNAVNAQSKLAQKTEAAKIAWQNAAKSESKSAEEIQKLKKEYDDLASRLSKADKAVSKWENKIKDTQIAENKLKVAVSQTNDEIKKLNTEQNKNIKNTQNATTESGKLLNIYTLIKGLAVGYAGKTLFEALIGGNAQFEQYMTSFEVLLGSAEKAKKQMEDINTFAAKTPFELSDVTEATQMLLSYGVAQDQVMTKLQQLGDLSGGNAQKLDSISLAYGKMVSKGKVSLEELNMMTEAGVPIIKTLGSIYDMTGEQIYDAISKGKISVEAINEAMRRMTSEGGQFYGMMEKQSQTMTGLWSTLKDNVSMFAREVGESSFEYLKSELSSFMDTLSQMSDSGELSDIASEWGSNIAAFTSFLVEAVKILWEMKDALIAVGAGLAITSIINGCAEAFKVLSATLTFVKAGMDATKVSNDVLNASLIKSPWGLVATAIGLVSGALITYILTTGKAETEADKLAKKTNELTQEYENSVNSIDKQTKSSLGEIEMAQRLTKKLEDLSNKTNKTTADKQQMSNIVDQLNQKIPNLALAINSETGELNKQINTVYNAIDAYKQLLFVKAADKKASAAAENILSLNDQKAEIQKAINSNQKTLDDANKKISSGMADVFGESTFEAVNKSFKQNSELNSIINDRKNLQSQLDTVNKSIAESEKQINDSYKLSEEYAKKYGSTTSNATFKTSSYAPPLLGSKNTSSNTSAKATSTESQKAFSDLKFALDMQYITETEYYKKLAILRDTYYKSDSSEWQRYTLEIKQYNDKLKENVLSAEKDEYTARRQNSDNWIERQKYYGKLSSDEEIAAYERVKAYTKDYYKQGVVDYSEYLKQTIELDKDIYATRKQTIENEISANVEAQKKILNARKTAIEEEAEADKKRFDAKKEAIEEEYAQLDLKDAQNDRNEQLSELIKQESIFSNAVTKEGKDKLKDIQDQIKNLNEEAKKEERETNKKKELADLEEEQEQAEADRESRLKDINSEYETLDNKQKTLLSNISEYATLSAGALETVTNKIKAMLDVVSGFSDSLSIQSATATGSSSTTSYTYNQTNNNNITDTTSANIFAKVISAGFQLLKNK